MLMWDKGVKWHTKQILIGIDQLINTFLGGWSDETLSSRCYRNAQKYWYAKIGQIILDFIFRPWGKNHCYESYLSEVNRNHLGEDFK